MRARLRATVDGVVLALKDEGTREGDIHARLELEGPATASLDPTAWLPSPARALLVETTGGAPLVVVASLRQRRRVRRLRRGDTEVELSLDTLEALGGGGEAEVVIGRRSELEAELVAGSVADLRELAAALRALPGIGDAGGSKWRFARDARMAATER